MSMYDTPEGAVAYAEMAAGYDGRTHVERLTELLAPGSEVLELGIGPGVDLDMLADTLAVVGSDTSQAFLDRYARTRPDIELVQLDAITIDTDRRFDAIYSNKVLHHLTRDELRRSLQRARWRCSDRVDRSCANGVAATFGESSSIGSSS